MSYTPSDLYFPTICMSGCIFILARYFEYIHDISVSVRVCTGSLLSGEGEWAGGIVGLERNYEV